MTDSKTTIAELFDRGTQLLSNGKAVEALECFHQALELSPRNPTLLLHTGAALHELGSYEEAASCYRQIIQYDPECGEAYNNLGNSLLEAERFDDARAAFSRACRLMPSSPVPLTAHATTLIALGRIQDAEADCRRALQLDSGFAEAHWNLSLCLLAQGKFSEGWQEHEWRWQKRNFTSPRRHIDIPLWDRSPLAGKTILLHAEQGFGDAIQFVRYARLIAAQDSHVIIECHPPLVSLFEGIDGILSVVPFDAPLPACDCQAPLLSLPLLMGTTLDTIPATCPYLSAPLERLPTWQNLTAPYSGLKIGIAWAGSSIHRNDRLRSLPSSLLEPLFGLANLTFFSLQIGEAGHQLERSPLPAQVVNLCDRITDFGDTAALVEQLDLVITVDTAVAHLVGALGKPAWVMLPFAPDWRWLLDREDSPWYPTMRLFRQGNDCTWQPVIKNICDALSDLLNRPETPDVKPVATPAHLCPFQAPPLRIFCYRPEIDYLLTKANRYGRPVPLAQLIDAGHAAFVTVESPETADFILFPEYLDALLDQVGVEGTRRYLRELPLFKDYEERHIFFSNHDNAIPLGFTSVFFQVSVNRFNRDPHVVALPYPPEWANDELLHFDFSRIRYLASFNGNIASSLIRSELVLAVLQEPRLSAYADPLPGFHCHQSGDIQEARRIRYLQTLADSLTILCPRGEGPNSIRFFESMALGRIPVLVSDSCLLPFEAEINYSECTFRIAEADIPDAGKILADWIAATGEKRLLEMCRQARTIWEQHFSTQGIQRHIVSRLYGLLSERCVRSGGPTADAAFADVLGDIRNHYVSGELATVRKMCDHLIAMDPSRDEAYHLRGMASFDDGEPAEAFPYLLKAAEIKPAKPEYSIALANALLLAGHAGDAETLLRALLESQPAVSEAWLLLGKILSDQGHREEALRCFRRAEALAPHDYRAPLNAGHIYLAIGDLETAERFYVRTQILQPDCEEAGLGLERSGQLRSGICTGATADGAVDQPSDTGNTQPALADDFKKNEAITLHEHGDFNTARHIYDGLLRQYPDDHELWYLRGTLALQEAQHQDAMLFLRRAHQMAPATSEYILNLAVALQHENQSTEAEALLRRLLVSHPDNSDAWINLGVILKGQNRLDDALDCFQRAASITPHDHRAPQNAGAICQSLGRLDEALQLFMHALALKPDYGTARWNLAILKMLLGNYSEGMADFDARFHKTDPVPYRHPDIPEWDGKQSVERLLVWDEQGYGDAIQCCRYIPLIKDRVEQVYIECISPVLKDLLKTVRGVANVFSLGEQLPPVDAQIPIMSLMRICGTTLQNIPGTIPYLHARPETAEAWLTCLPATGARIGLVWRGNPGHINNANRSCPVAEFLRLVDGFPDTHFFSLQLQPDQEERGLLKCRGITDQTARLKSFLDTAALIQALDLVISVDTAVAHLAGALGKPVWLLLPFAPDWRWGLEQENSPWYPTMRIFRQQKLGDWAAVIDQVRGALSIPSLPSRQPPESLLVAAEKYRAEEAWDKAFECYQGLLALDADDSEALMGAGGCLYFLNRFMESASYYLRVLAKMPDTIKAHVNLGMSLLAAGHLEEGWPELEWRLKYVRHQLPPIPLLDREILNSGNISGKTVLLHTEQGYGDSLQFIRYAEALSQRGAHLLLTAQPEMLQLLGGCPGIEQVIPHGELLPAADYQALLQSLPAVFSTSLANIPATVPYLFPEEARVEKWQRKLGSSAGSLTVGLCWHGRQMSKSGYNRSVPAGILAPLLEVDAVTFVNLTKDSGCGFLPGPNNRIIDLTPDISDFADTAALIANLDLVISIDTAVAHLAGALGKPVWTLLLHSADWRWLDKREDSPWYPTMKLFRQPSPGRWSNVISRVSEALKAIVQKKFSCTIKSSQVLRNGSDT